MAVFDERDVVTHDTRPYSAPPAHQYTKGGADRGVTLTGRLDESKHIITRQSKQGVAFLNPEGSR
ncbi:hypothetical protein E2C01_001215 [Portunus trituberculatus]|uniref:Uncharacterized protein n=1 Tax=Portunus trituberculatus TaxID=210409 RepID=A0A5B7CJW1_PORTR|nr:hypothetical protein [Portunus trituberculatus]